jgi:hypothetical protein
LLHSFQSHSYQFGKVLEGPFLLLFFSSFTRKLL